MLLRPLRTTAALAVAAFAFGSLATAATADDANVDATVSNLTGAGRSFTTISDVTLVSTTGFDLDGSLAFTVTEIGAPGSVGWNVTAQASNLAHDVSGALITSDNLSVGTRVTTPTGLVVGTTVSDGSGTESLDAARTLFTVNGQDASDLYSGVYAHAAAIDLQVPNGSEAGSYSGTLTLTIVQ